MAPRFSHQRFWLVLALFLLPTSLRAQDRSVVLVHGIWSHLGTWDDAATRLSQDLAVNIFRHNTGPNDKYEDQAASLKNQLLSDPTFTNSGTPILIGHSNGGLVSRELSKTVPVDGIVTLASPHLGAPLVESFYPYLNFLFALIWEVTTHGAPPPDLPFDL